jgi:hypothetical protein
MLVQRATEEVHNPGWEDVPSASVRVTVNPNGMSGDGVQCPVICVAAARIAQAACRLHCIRCAPVLGMGSDLQPSALSLVLLPPALASSL